MGDSPHTSPQPPLPPPADIDRDALERIAARAAEWGRAFRRYTDGMERLDPGVVVGGGE